MSQISSKIQGKVYQIIEKVLAVEDSEAVEESTPEQKLEPEVGSKPDQTQEAKNKISPAEEFQTGQHTESGIKLTVGQEAKPMDKAAPVDGPKSETEIMAEPALIDEEGSSPLEGLRPDSPTVATEEYDTTDSRAVPNEPRSPLHGHDFQSAGPLCACGECHYFPCDHLDDGAVPGHELENDERQIVESEFVESLGSQGPESVGDGSGEKGGLDEHSQSTCSDCGAHIDRMPHASEQVAGLGMVQNPLSDEEKAAVAGNDTNQVAEGVADLVEESVEKLVEELAVQEFVVEEIVDELVNEFVRGLVAQVASENESEEHANDEEEAMHVAGLRAVAARLNNDTCGYVDDAVSSLYVEPGSSLHVNLSSGSRSADGQDVNQDDRAVEDDDADVPTCPNCGQELPTPLKSIICYGPNYIPGIDEESEGGGELEEVEAKSKTEDEKLQWEGKTGSAAPISPQGDDLPLKIISCYGDAQQTPDIKEEVDTEALIDAQPKTGYGEKIED